MIRVISYRRLLLDNTDGCTLRHCGIALALACHKGNAQQQQESQETGAQTQGVATSGSDNSSNSGTVISTAPAITGKNNKLDASNNYNLTNGSSVQITDDNAVNDALSSLNNALTGAQQLVGDSGQALVDSNTQALQLAAQSAENQAQSQQDSLSAWIQSIPTWQIIAFAVATLGILVGLPLYLSRKSK